MSLNPTRDLREFIAVVYEQMEEVLKRLDLMERRLRKMPTREDFDELKQQLKQAIADAAQRVADDVQALRDELAKGNDITDADLSDLQADIQALGQIDPTPNP